jgi:hypothetical protein
VITLVVLAFGPLLERVPQVPKLAILRAVTISGLQWRPPEARRASQLTWEQSKQAPHVHGGYFGWRAGLVCRLNEAAQTPI